MDSRVYSFNYQDREKRWQAGFRYDGEHIYDDKLISWDDYLAKKDAFIQNNLKNIGQIGKNAQPIDDYLGMSMMERMRQNVSSDGAWRKVKDIINGQDGTVMSMDIETVGDVATHMARGKHAQYSGITEMGFAFQDFKNGFMSGDARTFALVDGFNAEQTKAAMDILNAYKRSGWDSLTKDDQWLMKIMSSYGQDTFDEIVRKIDIPELGGQYWTLTEKGMRAGTDPTNFDAILRGIKTWDTLYKRSLDANGNFVSNIEAGTKYMAQVLTENKMGIISANSAFEATALGASLRKYGSSGEELMNKSADVVYASTIIGRANSMSSFRLQTQALGHASDPSAPNSVQSLNMASGLYEKEIHHGPMDALQQIRTGTTHQFYDGKSFPQLTLEANQAATRRTTRKGQAASRDIITDLDYGNQYFFMKGGSLDKNNIDTVVTTLGDGTQEAAQDGTIRGRYYTIDEDGSGWTKFNAPTADGFGEEQDVYVLKMQDAYDSERTVYKGFQNKYEADKWREQYMIGVDKNTISNTDIRRQAELSEIDIGRRKFDSFFNANDISVNYKGEVGGYNELVQYLDMARNSDQNGHFTAEFKQKHGLKATASDDEVLREFGIKSKYQKTEYVNAIKRVRSEESALTAMVDEIGESISSNRNIARTAALKDLRDKYIESIESIKNNTGDNVYARIIRDANGGAKELRMRKSMTIQDAFSLDVVVGDNVRRVTGDTYDNLVYSLSKAYKGASKEEIQASITELISRNDGSRNLISNTKPFIDLKDYLDDVHVPESKYFNTVFSDMAMTFDREFFKPVRENSKGPMQYFSARNNGGNSRGLRLLNDIIGDTVEMNSETLYKSATGNIWTLNDMFNKNIGMNQDAMKQAARDVVDRINGIRFVTEAADKTKTLNSITESLGYSTSQASIIRDLFGANPGDPKKYATTAPGFEDVQWHILSPDKEGGSAFGVFTTREHANAVEKILLDGSYDMSSRKALEEAFGDNAAVIEFKALHKTKLMDVDHIATAKGIIKDALGKPLNVFNGDARAIKGVLGNQIYLTTVSQGALQEKFALPGIESYIKDGVLNGGFQMPGDSLVHAYRMRFGQFLEAVNEGRFSSASRLINNALNDTMKPWASPNGRRTLAGQMMSMNDILHGFQFDGSGLRETFNNEVRVSLQNGLTDSPLVKLVEAVGFQTGTLSGELNAGNVDRMLDSAAWKEFYAKNLLVSNVNQDQVIKDAIEANRSLYGTLEQDRFSKNILDLMIDQHDVLADYRYKDLVYKYTNWNTKETIYPIREGLMKVKQLQPFLSQLVAPGHYDDMMTLVNSGQIIDMAGINPSMRPTFGQILNGMYFDPNALDKSLMTRLAKTGTKVGSSSQSLMEYALVNNVAGLKIKSPTGIPYTEMERQITTPFKQMNDAELILKYKALDAQYRAGEGVFDPESTNGKKYRRAYEIFKAENPSLNEGKIIGSSELLNQAPFTSPDVKKIRRYDLQSAAESDATLRDAFVRELEKRGGEMHVTEGSKMLEHKYITWDWDGPNTVLTMDNIDDLLETGETKILPSGRMVNDVKFMFQQEKSMVHYTYIDDDFVKQSANQIFGTAEEARRYQGLIMDLVTGYKEGDAYRPMFIGNLAGFKHGNQIGLDSMYRTIVNEYAKADALPDLAEAMRHIDEFQQMSPFIDNGKIILNQRNMKGMENAISKLREALENGEGNKQANKALFGKNGILDQMLEDNVYYLEAQRTNVNEVMAEKLFLDERMAQGVRLRAYDEFRSSSDEWIDGYSIEDRYLSAMKQNAVDANQEIMIVKGGMDDADKLISNTEKSVAQVAQEKWVKTRKSQEEVVQGMWASVQNYAGTIDPREVNSYVVNLDDVLDMFGDPKSIGVQDIKEKMFKIEGELPEYLKAIDISGSPKNIYFKFNKAITGAAHKEGNKWINGRTFDGILVPLYDIRRLENGELNFTDAQTSLARFLNVYNKERLQLQSNSKDLTTAFDNMMKGLQEELRMYDKDSFLYKTSGRTRIPNSMQLLAQDEMAPIVEAAWDDRELARGVKRERKIYSKIAKAKTPDEFDKLVKELDDISIKRKEILGKVADDIQAGVQNKKLYQISDLHMLGMDYKGMEMVNGKMMLGNTHAMSSKTMRKMGVNTGVIGYQVFKDIETESSRKLRWYESNKAFNTYIKGNYLDDIQTISEHFELKGFAADKSITDPGKRLMRQINEFTKKNGFLDINGNKAHLEPEAMRAQIRENREFILGEMDILGKRYLTDVGLVTREVWRPPVFSAQTNARIYLDESVGYGQIRTYTGGLISKQNNLDFDGDMEMTSFILDKRGGMLNLYENGKIADNELGLAYKSYMASLPANNKIMADLIRDGDAFKADMLNDEWVARAKVVEKFDNNQFIEGVENYMKVNNIAGNAQDFADSLTNGQYLKMAYSDQMKLAVQQFSADHSMTTNVDLIRASITARVRKENIGAISTPNYKLRDTLLMIEKAYAADKDEVGQKLVKEIFADLTGIGSDKILDIAEQKAIDVKHIVDAVNVAETGKWASGMNLLFNNNVDAAKRLASKNKGLRQMMAAVNMSTFKAKLEELDRIAEEIIAGSRESFRKELADTGSAMADMKLQFRALYDAAELKGARDIQNSILRGSRTFLSGQADLVMAFQNMAGMVDDGTSTMGDLLGFAKAFSDSRVIADTQSIYVSLPTATNDAQGIGFYALTDIKTKDDVHKLTFQEIDLNALNRANPQDMDFRFVPGSTMETSGTFNEINEWLRQNFVRDADNLGLQQVNPYMFVNSPEVRQAQIANARHRQITDQLNEFLNNTSYKRNLKAKTTTGFDVFENFQSMGRSGRQRFGQAEYDYLMQMMPNKAEVEEARNLYMDYHYWRQHTSQGMNSKGSGQDLIRAVNENIANNYGKKIDPARTYTTEILEMMQTDDFGMSVNAVQEIRAQRAVLGPDFDGEAWRAKTGELNRNIYDIIPSEKHINDTFDIIDQGAEKAEKLRAPAERIQEIRKLGSMRDTVLEDAREAITRHNSEVMDAFNKEVYGGMFTETRQLDNVFNWQHGIAQPDMMVGFGRYTGMQFRDLNADQVQEILDAVKTTQGINDIHNYAIKQTGDMLKGYKATKPVAAFTENDIFPEVYNTIEKYKLDFKGIAPSEYEAVTDFTRQNGGMRHKTIRDSLSGMFDGIDGTKVMKGTAVVVGAMAAIGVVNNLLHKDSHKSPLSPEFSDDKNDPGFKDGAAHPDVQPRKKGGGGKIYAQARGGGKQMQFKVNAKTRSTLSDQSNARLISMANGGQANVMVTKDTSGVNDNWLANKFAQLSL